MVTSIRERKIYLVDGHPVVLAGLQALLESQTEWRVVQGARNVQSALEGIERSRPDLVIIELALQGMHGLDFIRLLRTRFPNLRVLCYSMHEEIFYAERSLKAGAQGYLMKSADPETLLEAVRSVFDGERYLSERMKRKHASGREMGGLASAFAVDALTDRELEIMQYLGEQNDNRRIAERLKVSLKTVEAHRSRIREKLNLRNSNELIRYAVQWVGSACEFESVLRHESEN